MAIILGLDYGLQRVGVAISDEDETIALPIGVIQVASSEQLLHDVQNIVKSRSAKKVVIGMPFGLSGISTEQTEITKQFIEDLRKVLAIPIDEQDERLSSAEADKASGPKVANDAHAAMLILQTYIDRQHLSTTSDT